MGPPDIEGREEAAWAAFLQQLADHLAAQWPAMHERLGDRTLAFVEVAAQQAGRHRLVQAAAVARYANLCFVWGPGFQDKPGFAWAQGLLAAPAEREWATVHQLVQRSAAELQRLPEARIAASALLAADERLVAAFGHLGRQGALHPPEPPALPLKACDLEALELRLLEPAVAEQYMLEGSQWLRAPLPPAAPVRVDAAHPMPRLVAVLARAPGARPQARVQLRSRSHAACNGDVHPALEFGGGHGLWRWAGHEARAVNWAVSALAQPPSAAGPGTAVAEETSPDIFSLTLEVCGLRDEGDALGTQSTQLWAWPAEQWWAEIQREAAAAQPVVAGRAPALPGHTRCKVECDGAPCDALPLRQAFENGLDRLTATALQTLLDAWSAVPGLEQPRLDGALTLLSGRAALSWGWRLGPNGLAGRALMRVVGALDLKACESDLHAEGELTAGGGRARVALRCTGAVPLVLRLQREAAEPPLLAALLPARVAIVLDWVAEVTPLATETGTLLQSTGPCKGQLVGEAGLRPRTSGGSGWEWFATLRLTAASLALAVFDPVLGEQRFTHTLWAEQPLVDWKVG